METATWPIARRLAPCGECPTEASELELFGLLDHRDDGLRLLSRALPAGNHLAVHEEGKDRGARALHARGDRLLEVLDLAREPESRRHGRCDELGHFRVAHALEHGRRLEL